MSILSIIERIAATSSKNEKVAVLTQESGNLILRQVLVACYDPTINYWIKKIPTTESALVVCDTNTLENALSALTMISSRKITGHAALKHLQLILESLSDDDAEIIRRVVLRDMRAGFSASTINKVWKGLIKETQYMRCSLVKELKGKNSFEHWPWEQGVPVQLKADGQYCFVNNYINGDITFNTRAGSIYDNDVLPSEFVKALSDTIPLGMQSHGELLVTKDGTVLPREVGNGMLNSVLKGTPLEQGYSIKYLVWDMIPIDVAVPSGKHHVPYHDRFAMVCNAFHGQNDYVNVIETVFVKSLKEAMDFYAVCLSKGLEGAVVKHPLMIWEDTTSRGQVKLKLTFQVELEVISKIEGKGKFAGMLGALECKSSCGKLIVNVSGFSDKQRKDFWESDKEIKVGSIIQVNANNISQNNGIYSLFLPVFEEVRNDKSEADSLERIIAIYESAINPS